MPNRTEPTRVVRIYAADAVRYLIATSPRQLAPHELIHDGTLYVKAQGNDHVTT